MTKISLSHPKFIVLLAMKLAMLVMPVMAQTTTTNFVDQVFFTKGDGTLQNGRDELWRNPVRLCFTVTTAAYTGWDSVERKYIKIKGSVQYQWLQGGSDDWRTTVNWSEDVYTFDETSVSWRFDHDGFSGRVYATTDGGIDSSWDRLTVAVNKPGRFVVGSRAMVAQTNPC